MENPKVAVLEGIAAALGVEIEALFARPEPGDAAPGALPSRKKRRTASNHTPRPLSPTVPSVPK